MSTAAVISSPLPSDPGPGDARSTSNTEKTALVSKFTQPGPVVPNWLDSLELRNLPRLPIPQLDDTLKYVSVRILESTIISTTFFVFFRLFPF